MRLLGVTVLVLLLSVWLATAQGPNRAVADPESREAPELNPPDEAPQDDSFEPPKKLDPAPTDDLTWGGTKKVVPLRGVSLTPKPAASDIIYQSLNPDDLKFVPEGLEKQKASGMHESVSQLPPLDDTVTDPRGNLGGDGSQSSNVGLKLDGKPGEVPTGRKKKGTPFGVLVGDDATPYVEDKVFGKHRGFHHDESLTRKLVMRKGGKGKNRRGLRNHGTHQATPLEQNQNQNQNQNQQQQHNQNQQQQHNQNQNQNQNQQQQGNAVGEVTQGLCALAQSNCPLGWLFRGVTGLLGFNKDLVFRNTLPRGPTFNADWTWVHPVVCCSGVYRAPPENLISLSRGCPQNENMGLSGIIMSQNDISSSPFPQGSPYEGGWNFTHPLLCRTNAQAMRTQGTCLLGSDCPSEHWTPRGTVGLLFRNDDASINPFVSGASFNATWRWSYPRLCCRK